MTDSLMDSCKRDRGYVIALMVVGVVWTVGYAILTRHVWEDFLITFRHSENMALGRGLTYNVGTRVHGFTSPLGVLLPGVFHWAVGREGDFLPALWAFRAVSSAAFAGTLVLVFLAVKAATGKANAGLAAAGLILLDPKSVDYSTNGQETALMLFWVAMGVWLSLKPVSGRWRWWAVMIAGLQWTRPDGFVFAGALLGANLVFALEPRRQAMVAIVKAGLLGLAMYLPWLAWATWYYGSPVPQTVLAKFVRATVKEEVWTHHIWPLKVLQLVWGMSAQTYFPIREWPWHMWVVCLVIGATALVGFGSWAPRLGRLASVSFLLAVMYLAFMRPAFPWYFPPAALLAFVSIAAMLGAFVRRPLWRRIILLASGLIIIERGWFVWESGRQLAAQQEIVEEGVRKQVGLYLRERMKPGDRVYCEALGYIGYYSQAVMRDFPGLASPEVTDVLRKEPHFAAPVKVMHPEWIALRPAEVPLMDWLGDFRDQYKAVKEFNHLREVMWSDIYGEAYLTADAVFTVYHRRDLAAEEVELMPITRDAIEP